MITFSFGRNWKRYVKYILNEQILQSSQNSLVQYFGESFDFTDKVFVDVGCGSGIFSLCALRLGCKKIISIDVDKNSIDATNMAKAKFNPRNQENWEIIEGSILDDNLLQILKSKIENESVIVYSWGVLHHTGNLQKAMDNVMALMAAGGGQLCLYRLLQQNTSKHLVA